jgi:hypothetical protein
MSLAQYSDACDVAHAPSKAQDAAAGKSFVFNPIVARPPGKGTLVSALGPA